MDVLSDSDIQLRAVLFTALLGAMIAAELIAPRRRLLLPRLVRWLPNLTVGSLNILVLRFGLPMLGVSLAYLVK